MEQTRTPLSRFAEELAAVGPQPGSQRGVNMLDRAGFVWAEEVRACPDVALLAVRNIGTRALEAIRQVLGPYTAPSLPDSAATPPAPIPGSGAVAAGEGGGEAGGRAQDHAGDVLAEREHHVRQALSTAAAARYPELVRALPRTRMPVAALTAICAALNAEPSPPADPMVDMLLETAGESGLLELYRTTHATDPD